MGRVKILGYAYRQWATSILNAVSVLQYTNMQIENEPSQVNKEVVEECNPDLILFYGWSWKVPDWLVDEYICLGLHPSPLPKYRGGSPIQHQILNGEKTSAVSIFGLTKELDAGPLCAQVKFPLDGSLREIFNRIMHIGTEETLRIIKEHKNGKIKYWKQKGQATTYPRRLPKQSEITQEEWQGMPAKYIYNKIRCLQDPYPNAYTRCADGNKLYLTESHL